MNVFEKNRWPKDTLRKLHINFRICTYLESAPSPMCLQSIIMESKRTLKVPHRSLRGFWHKGCPKDTSRKLGINFQISTFLKSRPTPFCSMESLPNCNIPQCSLECYPPFTEFEINYAKSNSFEVGGNFEARELGLISLFLIWTHEKAPGCPIKNSKFLSYPRPLFLRGCRIV